MTKPPIMVRNTQPGPTVFTSAQLGQHVEWHGQDDPNGGDVQACPAAFLDDVQFRNSLIRGIFVVEETSEVTEDIMARHREEWQDRQSRQREASEASIDQVADNDLLMLTCVGPNGHSGTECGTEVPVQSRQVAEKPPLCQKHKGLAGQFLPEETDKTVNGKPVIRWIRTGLGARERQQN